jgi:hypothetical protein
MPSIFALTTIKNTKMENLNSISQKTEKGVALIFTGWGLLAYTLGATGFYTYLPKPILGLTIVLFVITLLVAYNKNVSFKDWINNIPFRYLTLFHFWRIFGGLAFLSHVTQLPSDFAYEAAYGDIIAGFMSIIVFIFFQKRVGYIVFNIVGMLDLVLALSLGMFNAITDEPKMTTLAHLPFTFILLFGVPILIFIHIVSLNKLFNSKM